MNTRRPLREISPAIHDQLIALNDYSTEEVNHLTVWLLEHYLNVTRTDWLLNKSVSFSREMQKEVQGAVNRLVKGEPIQYVLGECDFYGRKFVVTPDVLIPRRETEELVRMVIENERKPVRVLDVGTGSGCIAIALAKEMKDFEVWAVDINESALWIAKQNAQRHEATVAFKKMDILKDGHFTEKFDIVVSNPPYVRRSESEQMTDRVLRHEPPEALFVEDAWPLVFYQRMAELSQAGKLLRAGGRIYWEINEALGEETRQMLALHSFSDIAIRRDMQGKDRFVVATLQI